VRPFSSKGIGSHFETGAIANVAPHVSVGASGYAVRAAGEQQIISKLDEQPAPAQGTTSTSQSQTTPQQSSPSGVISTLANKLGVGNSGTGSTGTGSPSAGSGNVNGNGVIVTQQEIIGPAALGNDHGFSTWLTVRPSRTTDLQIGYSRSMGFQYNSLFFGIGFRVGH